MRKLKLVLILLAGFLVSTVVDNKGLALTPPYCPDQVFIDREDLSVVPKLLGKISPFNHWEIKEETTVGLEPCAGSGYIRPDYTYIYKSPTTGIAYHMIFLITIPVDERSGKLKLIDPQELAELVLGARLSLQAIEVVEGSSEFKSKIQKNLVVGRVDISEFPDVQYYPINSKIELHSNFDKDLIYSQKFIKWDKLPNPEYNSQIQLIKAEIAGPLTRSYASNNVPTVLISLVLLGVILFMVFKLIKRKRAR